MKEEITRNTTEIQGLQDSYIQSYVTNLDNLKEMDRFLELYNLSRHRKEEIQNLKKPNENNE